MCHNNVYVKIIMFDTLRRWVEKEKTITGLSPIIPIHFLLFWGYPLNFSSNFHISISKYDSGDLCSPSIRLAYLSRCRGLGHFQFLTHIFLVGGALSNVFLGYRHLRELQASYFARSKPYLSTYEISQNFLSKISKI